MVEELEVGEGLAFAWGAHTRPVTRAARALRGTRRQRRRLRRARPEQVESNIPRRRAGTSDEMGGVACLLASDHAVSITGHATDAGLTYELVAGARNGG
jgi:enoyl-[acyl-carrier-protein] reductase (NADH)